MIAFSPRFFAASAAQWFWIQSSGIKFPLPMHNRCNIRCRKSSYFTQRNYKSVIFVILRYNFAKLTVNILSHCYLPTTGKRHVCKPACSSHIVVFFYTPVPCTLHRQVVLKTRKTEFYRLRKCNPGNFFHTGSSWVSPFNAVFAASLVFHQSFPSRSHHKYPAG